MDKGKEEKPTGALVKDSANATRVPVPPNMRTRRNGPRVIAALLVGIWLAVYYVGTSALATLFQESAPISQQVVHLGTSHWAIASAKTPDNCIGHVQSELTGKAEPQLALAATIAIPVFGQPLLAELNASAQFNSAHKLEDIFAKVVAGSASVTLLIDDSNSSVLVLTVQTPQLNRSFRFPRPMPIFLIEQSEGNYSLRIPKYLEEVFAQQKESFPSLEKYTGITFRTLEDDEVKSCQEQVLAAGESTTLGDEIMDIGGALKMFGIEPGHGIMKVIRGQK